jgi:hypothetical protein
MGNCPWHSRDAPTIAKSLAVLAAKDVVNNGASQNWPENRGHETKPWYATALRSM